MLNNALKIIHLTTDKIRLHLSIMMMQDLKALGCLLLLCQVINRELNEAAGT